MKQKIHEQVEAALKTMETAFPANKSSNLQAAVDNYQLLLDKGWAKKRGYSLQTIETAHLQYNRSNIRKEKTTYGTR